MMGYISFFLVKTRRLLHKNKPNLLIFFSNYNCVPKCPTIIIKSAYTCYYIFLYRIVTISL